MTSLVETSTVLGKRKTRSARPLVLHLSATDDSDKQDSDFIPADELSEAPQHEDGEGFSDAPQPRPHKKRSTSTGSVALRQYLCDFEGCDKSYTKAARLAEHARSHTGEVRLTPRFGSQWLMYLPCSALMCVPPATSRTSVKHICKRTPVPTYPHPRAHSNAILPGVISASGLHSISMYTRRLFIKALDHFLYVRTCHI